MQFKKVDVLITEDLTKEELKNKILAELNKVASKTNFSICYIANIHDVVKGKLTANTDRVLTELKGWSFNAGDNSINCHTNSAGYLYFISKIAKSSFSATIRVSDYNNSGDNDPVMLCVGDVTIDDKPFNLSFVRNKNAEGAVWVAKTSEPVKIPDNTIISNPFTKELFYSYNNTLTKIGRA